LLRSSIKVDVLLRTSIYCLGSGPVECVSPLGDLVGSKNPCRCRTTSPLPGRCRRGRRSPWR